MIITRYKDYYEVFLRLQSFQAHLLSVQDRLQSVQACQHTGHVSWHTRA